MNDDPKAVAKLVQERLIAAGTHPGRVRVLADEVTLVPGERFWYIPVSIQRDTENMGDTYQAFSELEISLEEGQGLRILLVPRIIPFQRAQDAA